MSGKRRGTGPIGIPSLRKAHEANDAAVLATYGFSTHATEGEIVAKLFEMYAELTGCSGVQE